VNANQANVPAHTMCRVLKVSASGYYAWRERAPSKRAIENGAMVERIRRIHAESDATYGMPRVRAELIDQGVRISGKRVARLMRINDIRGVSRRRSFIVTPGAISVNARRPTWSSASSRPTVRTSCGWPT